MLTKSTKSILLISQIIVVGVLFILTGSCKKIIQIPDLTTLSISDTTLTSAISGGNITSDGGDKITAKGICWSKHLDPTINDNKTNDGGGSGSFTSNMKGLSVNTTYYVRAYATNAAGTSYGNTLAFKTKGTVTDIDGNVYPVVEIGTQIWMTANLRVTHFNDGTPIPLVSDNNTWINLTTAGYCSSAISSNEHLIYGALYNWYAVKTGKLAPTGWHVPTETDWLTLQKYLGGASVAGGKLKETGFQYWYSPNSGATDESGFLAMPGGYRSRVDGKYPTKHENGVWFSSTGTINGFGRFLLNYQTAVSDFRNENGDYGFSVRCIKN